MKVLKVLGIALGIILSPILLIIAIFFSGVGSPKPKNVEPSVYKIEKHYSNREEMRNYGIDSFVSYLL